MHKVLFWEIPVYLYITYNIIGSFNQASIPFKLDGSQSFPDDSSVIGPGSQLLTNVTAFGKTHCSQTYYEIIPQYLLYARPHDYISF